jgi:uncharacterized repeat protein (TIGR02543 family)
MALSRSARWYSSFCLGIACLCLSISPATAEKPARKHFGVGSPFTVEELPAGKLKSQLQVLDPQARGKAMRWLHTLSFNESDAAGHLRVDKEGGVFIVCPEIGCDGCDGDHHHHGDASAAETANMEEPADDGISTQTDPVASSAAVPISSPPAYNSKPGAPFHIYLDFNGAYVTGKDWSATDGTTTWTTWDCHAWSLDSDRTTFSDAEQTAMRQIWERIAEDYAPFDVNVTTDVAYDPVHYTGDKNKVGWLLITPTTDKAGALCPHYGSGGVAYVGVFGNSDFFSRHQPAWVTDMSVPNIAEAASHEMGHNMGLNHDGTSTQAYYGGHAGTASAPSWGPIMGTGYGRNVSQWSKGEYYDANQFQDDLAIISSRVPYRVDEHGDSPATATLLAESPVSLSSVVEQNTDVDYFVFTSGAGTVTFNASAYKCAADTWGSNLDILLELYDSNQVLLASGNPGNDVNASITYNVPTAGEYYVVVRPTGCGSPLSSTRSGYTVYGSVGQYSLTGSFVPTDSILLASPNGGENWTRSTVRNITWASGMGGNVRIELYKGGSYQYDIKTSTPNDGVFEWLIPAGQAVGSDYQVKITSIEASEISDTSFANFSITAPSNDILVTNLDTDPGFSTTGLFEYGAPGGNNAATAPKTGTNMYDTDLNNTCWTASTLTTMALDCSKHIGVTLNFWAHKLVLTDYTIKFEVSNDGNNWTQLYSVAGSTSNAWVNHNYNISSVADRQPTVYVRWSMLGSGDQQYTGGGLAIDDISITGTFVPDDPPHGVTITENGWGTYVTEGGNTDTYSLVLDSQPAANVTITLMPDAQVGVSPTSLTFTTSNWATPQIVTVTAVNDPIIEATPHTGVILHTITSADAKYNSLSLGSLLVHITDNDNNVPVVDAGPDQSIYLTANTWSPLELSPKLWLDASDDETITLNGTTVSQWADKSGFNRHATASGTSQPTATPAGLNGKRVLTFDGGTDVLNVDLDFLAGVSHSAFIVAKPTTYSNIYGAANGSAGANSLHVGFSSATNYRMNYWGNDYEPALTSNFRAGSANVLNFAWTAGVGKQIFANGSSEGSNTNAGTIGTMSGGGRIGRTTGHPFFGGDIAEFIAITGTVGLAERQALEGYLAHKWGLTDWLPEVHPYKAAGPNNASATAILDGNASDADGHSLTYQWTCLSGPAPVTLGDAASIDTSATFTAEGVYTLRLTANDGFTQVSDDVVITVNPAQNGFNVTYSGNGSTGGSVPVDANNPYEDGATATVLGNTGSLVRTGYTFNGWNTSADGLGTSYSAGNTFTITGHTTLFARWTPLTYTVTFDKQGGSGGSGSVDATFGSAMPPASAPTRTGYTFAGYYAQVSGGGSQYYTSAMASARSWDVATNTTLYALWTPSNYTVSFDPNGGGTPSPTSKSVTFGSTYGTLATTIRTGYSFNGWFTSTSGGSQVGSGTTVTTASNHTLYAQWSLNFAEMDVTRSAVAIAAGGYDPVSGTRTSTGMLLTYTITNSGTGDLTLANAVISGETNCAVVIDTQPVATVGPSANTNLVATVTPAASGAWRFQLSIANNDPDESPYFWTVHGVAGGTATVSLVPSADTYINKRDLSANYGTSTTIALNSNTQQSHTRQGLLMFNLASVPTAATVTAASLDFVAAGGQQGSVEVFNVTGSWDEGSATWTNSNGVIGISSYGSANILSATLGTAVPRIALNSGGIAMVRGWINGTTPNNGFSIKTNYSNNSTNSVTVCSADHAEEFYRPRLTLTYTTDVEVPEIHVTRAGSLVADGGEDAVSGTTVGTGVQLTYAIANLGNANLSLSPPVSVSSATNCSVVVDSQPTTTVAPSTSTSLVLTITPTAAGSWFATISIANNDPNENPYLWTISGETDGSIYDDWALANGLAGAGADPDADSDKDGLTNLQEFAFGTDPSAGRPGPVQIDENGRILSPGLPIIRENAVQTEAPPFNAIFPRRKDHEMAGLIYQVQFSADLTRWTASAANPHVFPSESEDSMEAVRVPFPATVPVADLEAPQQAPKFFRVAVAIVSNP